MSKAGNAARHQAGGPSNRRGSTRRLLRSLTAVAASAAGVVALGAGAGSALAATLPWGYEQITPADGSSIDVYGNRVSEDMSLAMGTTMGAPMGGMPSDGRSIAFRYGLPRVGAPWTIGPVDVRNGVQISTVVVDISHDGSQMLYGATLPSVDPVNPGGIYRVDAQGAVESMTSGTSGGQVAVGTEDLEAVAFLSFGSPAAVYVGRPGSAPVQVSVDNAGNPMTATHLGGASNPFDAVLRDNAFAADGSSVIFTSGDGIAGDNDGGYPDVYRRILTPGAEETILISDVTDNGDPDPPSDVTTDPKYRWATADHQRIFFVTKEGLEAGDTDGQQDVYIRDGKDAPVRVSQGELVDGSPTGNATYGGSHGELPEWVMSSQDGNRTFFVTAERLTQDAPAGGVKLYERDVAEGRTRFVAPLKAADVGPPGVSDRRAGPLLQEGLLDLSSRGLRVTPNGAVVVTKAPLAGSPDDEAPTVFLWTRDGGLSWISEPAADAPPSSPGFTTIVPVPIRDGFEFEALTGGRGVTDDGSRVFFSTEQPLTAQDTDGRFRDVYVWTAGEGVSLVTPPGREPYDASYVDSSPDGSQVYLVTGEGILPGDTDPNAADVYLAILGGGAPPRKPGPDADPNVCGGDACQGPVAGLAPPSIGSVGFAGAGNLVASGPGRPSVAVSRLRTVTGSAARLRVRVPGAGRISVSGRSLRRTQKTASRTGTYSVRVALSSRAKRSLKRKRTLKVRVRVAYRASDGRMVARTVSVTFKQPKTKPAATEKGGR